VTAINPYDILDALNVAGYTLATPVDGGLDTTLWKVECRDATYALRLFREGQARQASYEAETMRTVAKSGIPVPAAHAEGNWQGQPVLLLGWCEGRTLMQEMRAHPWSIRRLGYIFGQRHAEMHRTVFQPADSGHSDWITRFGPIDDVLRRRLEDLQTHTDRLLHLDYHPLNVMVSQGRINCILDWTNAMPGEPRADVARTWSILRLAPLNPTGPEPVTEAARRFLTAGWLRGYQDTAGRLEDMDIFKLWAGVAMVHDMQAKVDRPENWIEQHHVDAIQKRVTELHKQAGLS
jgi:aminoglycoside phosphotransferase (APT) family kinase protein